MPLNTFSLTPTTLVLRKDVNRPLTWGELDSNFMYLATHGVKGDKGDRGKDGPQGLQGEVGLSGMDGRTLMTVSGVPSVNVGLNGDYAIDSVAQKIYGPKNGGAWPAGVSFKGDSGSIGQQGDKGNGIFTGNGAPDNSIGQNGDVYIDFAGQLMYGPKSAGAWPGSSVHLKGDQGNTGNTGDQGVPGPPGPSGRTILAVSGAPANGLGQDGDFAFDIAAQLIYGPKSVGVWGAGTNLRGIQGPAGSGTSVYSGSGVPSNALGISGDYYFDTTNGKIFGPKGASTWPAGVPLVGTLPIAQGGTGAVDAAAARTALGAAALDGSNATGTWPVNINGAGNSAVGGTLAVTGLATVGRMAERKQVFTATTDAVGGTVTLNLTGSNSTFVLNLNASPITVSFGAAPGSGTNVFGFTLKVINDATAGRSLILPAMQWPNKQAPTRTTAANGIDWWYFWTDDNGTTWNGSITSANAG